MQSGPFITFIADNLSADSATVAVFARELRKARLLTTGARGVNAPHMRPLDATRLLIALMATDRPSEAVASVERWGAMGVSPDGTEGDLPADLFASDPTLEQVLVRLIAVDPDPDLWPKKWPAFQVSRNEKTAFLEWGLNEPPRAVFRDTRNDEDRKEMRGIRRMCLVAPVVLTRIAAGMWADRFQGYDTNGHPLDLGHPWNSEGTAEERKNRIAAIHEYVRARDNDWRVGAE
jgi:hypothetical protein